MDTATLERRFVAIGARLKLTRAPKDGSTSIDVRSDRRGEFFEVSASRGGQRRLEVLDADRDEKCLLLLIREDGESSKFLCGYDERHWFVAAIPESARGVGRVDQAKDSLQPDAVRARVARVRPKDRFRRRNTAYVRQGEWFFLPQWTLEVHEEDVLHDEPLTRGRGKDHILELAFRRGGETVYVNEAHPNGISEAAFTRLSPSQQRGGHWRQMVRDPELYAKGTVSHPDHATIVLRFWHRVLMNTEQRARAMRHVAFLD
jgi:hypothetical protein